MPIEIKTANTNGIEMRYFSFGSGPKNMVIIPGLDVTSVTNVAGLVSNQYSDFHEDYTVYVIDRRTNLPNPYSIEQMAEDTVEVIKSIGIKDIYLYGVSQGGMISQVIAIKYPELVKKMVLSATTSRLTDETVEVITRWVETAETRDMYALSDVLAEDLFSKAFAERYGRLLFRETIRATDEDIDRYLILAKSIGVFDVYEELPNIKCDTLVIGAKDDKVFSYHEFEDIAEKIGCESLIYDGYSHCVFDENADVLVKIKEFFDK